MLLAVFSDTHGNTAGMLRAARRVSPDVLVFLGDYIRDAETLRSEFPLLPLHAVAGNCDFASPDEDTEYFLAGSVHILATHGHRYNVKYGTDSLCNAAFFSESSLALYGHTHIAELRTLGGLTLMNPGSAGTGAAPTFGTVEIADNGAVICRIHNI